MATVDVNPERARAEGVNTPLLIVAAMLAAVVVLIAVLTLRDSSGKGAQTKGRRPSA